MAIRSEPRFKTDTPAAIQVIRDKSRTMDCRITDVSGVGFQITLPEPLQQGEFIRILVDQKCVICVVRRCEPANSGFSLGLERVDEWAAGGEWNDQAPAAKPAAVKNPVGDLRSAAMHNLFGYREVLGRRISPRTFSLMLSTSALLAILSVGVAVRPKTHAAAAGQVQEAPKPQPTAAETATGSSTETADAKAVNSPASISTSPAPVAASTNTKESTPSAVTLKPVAPATPVATAATTMVAVNKVPASPASTAPAQPPSTGATTPPAGSPALQSLQIVASDMSWVAACADGKKIFENVMTAGSKTELRFSQDAVVRSGNAGALAITMGSRHMDSMGQRGVKAWLKASPDSLDVGTTPVAGACAGK